MSDGTLYEIAARHRAALLRGERQVASELVRAYGDIWQRIRRQLVYLLNEQELAGGVIDFEWWLEYDRLGKLQAQVEAELRVFAAFADGRLTAQQAEAVDAALRDTEQLVRIATANATVAVGWAVLPTAALEDLIGFTANGSPLRALFDALGPAASSAIRDALLQGLALGFNPTRIADEVRAAFGGNLARALTVCRTEVLRSYREASRRSYAVNSDVVDGWIWNCACTERSCAMCWAMHGTVHRLDEMLDDHPNGRCFPAGTLVSGPVPVAASMRYYSGKLVTIRTASGTELSFTPNHPILTRHGWVAGSLLQEGDDVIRSARSQDAASAIDKDYQHVPTRIEDVVKAFDVVLGEMPCSAEDFHGDGVGSKVHVILTNRLLRDGNDAAFGEPGFQQDFCLRAIRGLALFCLSALQQFVKRCFASACRFLGNRNSPVMLVNRRLFGHELISSGLVAQFDVGFAQTDTNSTSGNVECLGQTIFRFPGKITNGNFINRQWRAFHRLGADFRLFDSRASRQITQKSAPFEFFDKGTSTEIEYLAGVLGTQASEISLDRIIEISRRDFSGHVYNLQTKAGWYISNSIITHNCSMLPNVKPLPGMSAQTTPEPGPAQFARLTTEQQDAILGKAAGAAYRDGLFTLPDVVKQTFNPAWGPMKQVKSLREILR